MNRCLKTDEMMYRSYEINGAEEEYQLKGV